MSRLFRSKSWGPAGRSRFNPSPPSPFFADFRNRDNESEKLEEKGELESEDDGSINPNSKAKEGVSVRDNNQSHFAILDIVAAALKKSLVTCRVVGREEDASSSSLDISWPTEVRHVSHVTFDRLNGFLGLPSELEPELPIKVPSAR